MLYLHDYMSNIDIGNITCTVISDLSVTRLAPTLVRSVGVDAQLLTYVLASSALIQIPASGVVGIQHESGGTATRVTTFQIMTRHFTGWRIEKAFVYVCDTFIIYIDIMQRRSIFFWGGGGGTGFKIKNHSVVAR